MAEINHTADSQTRNAETDRSQEFVEAIRAARSTSTALKIMGGNSKAFYGRETDGKPLQVTAHQGVVNYEPTELVLTARGGTLLAEVESVLGEQGQMLPFEPPRFGPGATLGGAIACGLSGPRRPYAGAARDFVLGVKVLTGKGEILSFGGQVMKNVAGYDLSRLMAGSLGTLGILLEISLKVLPRPPAEMSLAFEQNASSAIESMNAWAGRPLPLSAACHDGEILYVRLSGTQGAVASAHNKLGGTVVDAPGLWEDIREHKHPFFMGDEPLWRLSVPPGVPPIDLPETCFIDWGGAQRWLRSDVDPDTVRTKAADVGGHATCFRNGDRTGAIFHPLAPGLVVLHKRLKSAFDPSGILNPGRMYAGF